MRRIFVYEFMTGGGLLDGNDRLEAALLREGRAMADALIADFARIEGVHVTRLLDHRLLGREIAPADVAVVSSADQETEAFARNAASADATIIIAPEFNGHLLRRAEMVIAAGGRLLGPSPAVISLASDKHATAEHLIAHGVRAPEGIVVHPNQPWPADVKLPAVAKPIDGAGSQDVQLLTASKDDFTRATRIEDFHPGIAASVAVLCLNGERMALPPCRQRLSDDGRFRYLGGSCPLPARLSERAADLAEAAIATLGDGAVGYLGVDLVLGDDPSGRDDVVIEINPRLTTSYVGLRALAVDNLAEAMLQCLDGRHPDVQFRDATIEFEDDGAVRPLIASVPAGVAS